MVLLIKNGGFFGHPLEGGEKGRGRAVYYRVGREQF